ncbi:MAG: family 16 glycosylhydrolase [Spirochaetes bacterium]|nr:family 16 glycosylhydrolase [Spirochaetota bacterium]
MRQILKAVLMTSMLTVVTASPADIPSQTGLVLWLDASDGASVTAESGDTVWKDKSPDRRTLSVCGKSKPSLVADAMNGKGVIRFDGNGGFLVNTVRGVKGPANVFIVSRRLKDQTDAPKWQRLVSSWDGVNADNKAPNFCVTGDKDGNTNAYGTVVYYRMLNDVVLGTIGIGANGNGSQQYFSGDIAEVLIYDRAFLTDEESRTIIKYLGEKWGAEVPPAAGWTRQGPLGETPKRVTDAFPLSDQTNTGGWTRHVPMCDEFNDDALDRSKWIDSMLWWQGRQPAWFSPSNVTVKDGMLNLTFRKEEPPAQYAAKGYSNYTSACVMTKKGANILYGYFEIRSRAMASAGSSAFWLQCAGWDNPKLTSGNNGWEIDVFELGGKAPGFEKKYNMNLHANRNTPEGKQHWSAGDSWISPFNFIDDFHTYGLLWGKKNIEYYVDGVLVRRVPNSCWHYPMYLIFDSEAMFSWLGVPKDEDLPSTFSIDYVRTWVRAE